MIDQLEQLVKELPLQMELRVPEERQLMKIQECLGITRGKREDLEYPGVTPLIGPVKMEEKGLFLIE